MQCWSYFNVTSGPLLFILAYAAIIMSGWPVSADPWQWSTTTLVTQIYTILCLVLCYMTSIWGISNWGHHMTHFKSLSTNCCWGVCIFVVDLYAHLFRYTEDSVYKQCITLDTISDPLIKKSTFMLEEFAR